MIHYTSVESNDYGWLVFKVIGAESKDATQAATRAYWRREASGCTLAENSQKICPLFTEPNLAWRNTWGWTFFLNFSRFTVDRKTP